MLARTVTLLPARFAAAAVVALLAGSCTHSPAEPGSLASITITRNPETLAIGATVQFTATGHDADGTAVGITPVWSVAAGGGAINSSGVFTAGTVPGTFANTIKATIGSISGTATAIVTVGPAATVTVTPTPVTLGTGASQQFTAVVKDAGGNTLSTAPTWTVVAGGGSINGTGLFTAGTVAASFPNTVMASAGGVFGLASVTVTAGSLASVTVTPNPASLGVGGTQQFTATGRDANGNVVSFTPTWAVQASGGTITSGGLFTAGASAGIFANTVRACSTVACASGSTAGFATVTVGAGALATITVTPNPVSLGTGASQQFTAVGRDAGGNVVAIPSGAIWSVAPGNAGGTVLGSGVYTAPGAVGVGFDTVLLTSGSIAGSAQANISVSGALVSIAVTPNPTSVVAGGTAQFTATGFDATGLVVPTPGLVWSVTAGGSINGTTGLFTAGLVTGTFSNAVRATSGASSGFATVIVTNVSPQGPSLGAAGSHGILAGTAVTCAGAPSAIMADVSVWPGIAITGFPPCTISGGRHQGDAFAQTAQGDLTTAFLALAAMPCGTTITADLGGTTLAPGVYCSLSSVAVTGTVTLNGPANAVFVIRAPSSLTTAGAVVMSGGAQAKNVYWWVGSSATLGSGSAWQGNILALTSITLVDGVTLSGRALARNGAVSLGVGSLITLP